MRRGLITGLIIGGVVGAYYGMNMGNRERRRLRQATEDLLDRGNLAVDRVKSGTARALESLR